MGTQGGGEAGNGPPEGLPDLPPDWGTIVVPDDPAELADEAELVRAELVRARAELVRADLRRRQRQHRLWWLLGPDRPGQHSIRLPAALLVVLVLATLAGLVAVSRAGGEWAEGGRPGDDATAAAPDAVVRLPGLLPALDLLDPTRGVVSVRSLLPAVILLTEGCGCADLIVATAEAAPPGTAVLVVARAAPQTPPGAASTVRPLADPAGELRTLLGLPDAAARAGVLVVTRSAEIIHAVPAAKSVNAYRVALSRLDSP